MAEMICSGIIPVLIAFWDDVHYIKIIVAILGATVAIFAGIHGLYNFHENWIEYRATSETLKHEKYMYLTKSGIYQDNEKAYNQLVERVESIISHENINWAQLNSSETVNQAVHKSASSTGS